MILVLSRLNLIILCRSHIIDMAVGRRGSYERLDLHSAYGLRVLPLSLFTATHVVSSVSFLYFGSAIHGCSHGLRARSTSEQHRSRTVAGVIVSCPYFVWKGMQLWCALPVNSRPTVGISLDQNAQMASLDGTLCMLTAILMIVQ